MKIKNVEKKLISFMYFFVFQLFLIMAIIGRLPDKNTWLISHEKFLQDIYNNEKKKTKWIDGIFDIKTPFMMDDQAKAIVAKNTENSKKKSRKRKIRETEILPIEIKMTEVLAELKCHFDPLPNSETIFENNRGLRTKVKDLMEKAVTDLKVAQDTHGSNCNEEIAKISVMGKTFLIPPKCEYFMKDISELNEIIKDNDKGKFKLIFMDPPWENKHVKRHKNKSDGYNMLSNEAIFRQINIPKFLDKKSGLLVIWCTNSQRHLNSIQEWLSLWNLKLLTKWYWLKVTKSGEPITNFDHPHKKPYELLILACSNPESFKDLPQEQIVISVPSGFHSHKPPLVQIFRELAHLSDNDKCLELFGRYLLPNCVTVGNQCLLFQNADIFF